MWIVGDLDIIWTTSGQPLDNFKTLARHFLDNAAFKTDTSRAPSAERAARCPRVMSMHPCTAVRPGRHADLLNTELPTMVGSIPTDIVYDIVAPCFGHELLSGQHSSSITGRSRGASAQSEWEDFPARINDGRFRVTTEAQLRARARLVFTVHRSL